MKQLLAILMLCALFIPTKGQLLSEKAKKMQTKTLLVVMEDATTLPAYNRHKNNPEKKAAFVERIAYQNEMLKFGFDTYWTFSKFEYKPMKEAFAMIKKEPELYYAAMLVKHVEMDNEKIFYGDKSNEPFSRRREVTNETLELRGYDPGVIFLSGLPSLIPSKGDMAFGVLHFQSSMTNWLTSTYDMGMSRKESTELGEAIMIKNAEELKGLTLMLCKDDLNPKLTEDKIKTVYPYPYKIVGYPEIEKAILAKEANLAYASIITMGVGDGKLHAQYFTRCSDGKVLFTLSPQVKVMPGSMGEKFATLEEKHLQSVSDYIAK